MFKSLKKRLIGSYMLVTIIAVFLISMLSNIFLERQFKGYIIENIQQKSKEVVQSITEQYQGNDIWNVGVVEQIGMEALENGLIVSVIDSNNKVIWDANVHNNGRCEELIQHLSQNMMNRYPNWKGGYVETKYPIQYKSKPIGTVEIGYYGPYFYSDLDILFLNTLNRIFVGVGIVSLCLALILGLLMAEGISRPISKVINAAALIAKGHYNDRIKENSGVYEINKLVATINGLADALGEQESLRKRLTGDVAHELRTPLATLQSHLEAIIDGIWEPTIDRIESCHEETVRINKLVGDLERLTKYESENLVLQKSEFDLGDATSSILMNFEKEYMDKGIEITYNKSKVMITADKDKISQVVINLLSNALKYTSEDGKVDIRVREEDSFAVLVVKDNGIGIADKDIHYIFERFYRVDTSRTRITGGAGIGLTIAKSIVEAHGGKIKVSSKLNEGTEFKVYLPLSE